MKVKEVMTRTVQVCLPEASLARAAAIMWEYDCGIVPVVDGDGRVVGMITDRDICMAAATKFRPAAEIAVREVMSGRVYACRSQDDVREALRTMAQHRVRRLPVIDLQGRIEAMLSMNDVLLKAEPFGELTYEDVVLTLGEICKAQRLPEGAIICGWEHR